MHLIERYGLSTGSQISKPYIYETYFPIPFGKYVTFQAQSKFESKDYSYWQDVLDFIYPILDKYGYKIIQTGVINEKPYKKVVDLRGQTSFNQLAYVMRGSSLHFGPDSLGVHLASMYDVPIVGLYSIIQTAVAGPYFGSKEKQILFESFREVGNGKPSYSPQENPKSINKIKPEDIANAIFKLLNIDFQIPFKTLYTGAKYGLGNIRQLIPNTTGVINSVQEPIEIRMDIVFNEEILSHHLSYLEKPLIITDKAISIDLLKYFKNKIQVVAYKITNEDNPKFVSDLLAAGIPVILISELSTQELEIKRLNYYEYGAINPMDTIKEEVVNKLKQETNLYYRSSLLIANEKNIYSSHAAIENNTPLAIDGEYQPVIDSPKFWKDLEFYTIIKGIKNN